MARSVGLLTVISALGLMLGGCSGYQNGDLINKRPQLVAPPDKVSAMLADAATRAADSLQTLAAIENHKGPAVAAPPIGNAPPELLRNVTLNWTGPVGPITMSMANRAGYAYTVAGTPPANSIVVSLDVERSTIVEVLRDIGLQLGKRADIRVDSRRRVIELHYVSNTGEPSYTRRNTSNKRDGSSSMTPDLSALGLKF